MKQFSWKRAAAAAAALFSLFAVSPPVFAQSSEPAEETPPATAAEEPERKGTTAKPFTPEGTGTVTDNATGEDGKEFFIITTPDENVFYLIIDRQRETENVYFLDAVTERDLLALAKKGGQEIAEAENTPAPPAPEPVPQPEPAEPKSQKNNSAGMVIFAALAVAAAGGAGYYFKVVRPRQEEPDEDDGEYGGEEYDGGPEIDSADYDEDYGEDEE